MYQDEFEKLGIDPRLAIKAVSAMFPVFANDVSETQYTYQPVSNIRSSMRAAQEERFDLYFMFSLDDIKVSRNIIKACLFDLDSDSLNLAIININKQGNISYLLEEIESLVLAV